MSILTYFTKAPTQAPPLLLTEKEEKTIDKALEDRKVSAESVKSHRGPYNSYTPEQRGKIGRYAVHNGPVRAAKHFSKLLGSTINESTARKFKKEYLERLTELSKKGDCSSAEIFLPTKLQGRPLLFGKELDTLTQDHIRKLRSKGTVINAHVVKALGEGILLAKAPYKLVSNGGDIEVTKAWAKSLLARMGYSKRKGTNAGKVSVAHFEELKKFFLADISAEVVMNDIPDELILNWDQTPLRLVPTGDWTMHKSGEKLVPIAKLDDKRQITGVFAVSLAGTYLPPQLIYTGKTERCHPKRKMPDGWDIWHSENHWANEETTKRYITKLILPYIDFIREKLKLEKTHTALVLYDVFKGQTTPAIKRLLADNHISVVTIPPNCTDKLQPLDISINKPFKDALKAQFHLWYANEVQKQLNNGSLDDINIDTSMTAIKGLSASWIIHAWDSIEQRPDMAISGFDKAGIKSALISLRD